MTKIEIEIPEPKIPKSRQKIEVKEITPIPDVIEIKEVYIKKTVKEKGLQGDQGPMGPCGECGPIGAKGKDGKTPTKTELKALIKEVFPEDKLIQKVISKMPKAEIDSIEIGEDQGGQWISKNGKKMYIKKSGGMAGPVMANGVHYFLGLLDAPDSYAGQAGKVVKVKSDESGLEFGVGGGGGTWGSITGTLSNQTDLQSAIDGRVPYTNASQDLNMTAYALKVKTTSQTFYDDFDVLSFGDPLFAQKRIAWSNGDTGNNWLGFLDEASGPLNIFANYYGDGSNITGIDHGGLSGLADDDHTQYALLAGRSGGQTLIGGTASGNNLTLQSTSNATKGKLLFGTSAYDEVNNRLGIGTAAPATALHVVGQVTVTAGGSASAPSYSFIGDTNTGMYRPSTDVLRFCTNGADRLHIASNGQIGFLNAPVTASWGAVQVIGTGTAVATSPILLIKHTTDDSAVKSAGITSETRMTSRYLRTWQNIGNNDNSFGNAGVINWTAFEYSDSSFITLATPTEFKGWNYQYWNGSSYKQLLKVGITGVGIGMAAIGTVPSAKLHVIETTEQLRLGYDISNYYTTTIGSTGGVTFNAVGSGAGFTFSDKVINESTMRLKGYTVATLPAGTQGDTAYCTDLLLPAFLAVAVGGGAVVAPVFYNGTQWIT